VWSVSESEYSWYHIKSAFPGIYTTGLIIPGDRAALGPSAGRRWHWPSCGQTSRPLWPSAGCQDRDTSCSRAVEPEDHQSVKKSEMQLLRFIRWKVNFQILSSRVSLQVLETRLFDLYVKICIIKTCLEKCSQKFIPT